MAAPILKHISPKEYLDMEVSAEEKHEYFDGEVVAMAGARENHIAITANLTGELHSYLKSNPCRVFPNELRVATPSSTSYMYPDVAIVCGKMEKKDGEFDTCTNPSVIIEVMSESTRNRDMGYKFFYYQQIPSLKEYILVDSLNYYVTIIRRQKDDSWKFDTTTDITTSLDIRTISVSIPLTDVYDKVSLP